MTDQLDKVLEDDAGRRPDVQPENVAPTEAIGVGGTAIYGGYIQPIEVDADLGGRERYRIFSEILANVTIVGAGVRFFLNLVAKAEWKVVPPEDSGAAGEAMAEQVDQILHDMRTPWHRVVRRAAMYRFYGFGIQEWTAKRREDGLIGFLDVEPRPQSTIEKWDTDRQGDVLGVVQRSPQTFEEIAIPREKFVYLCDDSLSDSPEGLGLFRHIVKTARRLERYEQLEGFGFEGDLRGTPLIRAPLTELNKLVRSGQLTAADRDNLLQPLKDFITNHIKNPSLGMLLDSIPYATTDEAKRPSSTHQYSAELMDGGSYSFAEVANAIKRCNMEIARVLGVEHLLLGDGDRGSHALSKDKSDNFGLVVDSTLKELKEAFVKDLLGPLFLLNGWDEDLMPDLVFDTNATQDLESVAAVIRDLAAAGVVIDREDEAVAELFRLMGLPRLIGALVTDPDATLSGSSEASPEDPEEDMPTDPDDDAAEES